MFKNLNFKHSPRLGHFNRRSLAVWIKTSAVRCEEILVGPSPSLPTATQVLRLTFITGPKVLFTSRISGKCAAFMVMSCAPSLLFFMVLTIPALLFQSPQQQAYFYFAGNLNQDPSRWLVLLLAAVCTVLSLAIPATMPTPPSSVSHY